MNEKEDLSNYSVSKDSGNSFFQLAEQFVNQTSQHIFLTGKAGTGKTTFLRHIVQTTHKHAVVAAPTGVAAINAGGVTLHSLFQLPFAPYIPNSKQDISHFSAVKLDVIRRMELLIIDEVSMLRSDVLDAIDTVLRRVRRSPKPFGGVQMLYIGDMFQLPPVVKDDEWAILRQYYPTQFFFHAHALQQIPPIYIELKKVFRQQDSEFVDLLNRVRNNIMQQSDFDLLNQRYIKNFVPPEDKKYITLTTHNYQADKINVEKLNAIGEQMYEFQGKIDKDFPEYALPTDMFLRLKLGAQVMFIANDMSDPRRFFNGKIGVVSEIDRENIFVKSGDDEIQVPLETWRNYRYTLNKDTGLLDEEILGTFVQYPLRLAWAITVHKSQGLTFNNVILDISRAFAAGQAYVALSRCTTLEGIVFQSIISPSAIQTDKYAIELSQKERSQIELENSLNEQKQIFWTEKLKSYFGLKSLYQIFYNFDKLLRDKIGEEFDDAKNLLEQMRKFARNQEDTIRKFQNQLQNLCSGDSCFRGNDGVGDLSQIKIRCQKAVEYFYPLYINNLLLPLRENINNFYGEKKAKAYYKHLLELEQDIKVFIEDLKKVRFYDVPIVDVENLTIPATDIKIIEKKPKQKKGDSAKISLEMFQSGKTITDIAAERNVTIGTIMGHLSDFISTGQVSVYDIIEKEKVEKILFLLEKMYGGEDKPISATPIKEQLGDDYSYDEIRAAAKYWTLENKKNEGDKQ